MITGSYRPRAYGSARRHPDLGTASMPRTVQEVTGPSSASSVPQDVDSGKLEEESWLVSGREQKRGVWARLRGAVKREKKVPTAAEFKASLDQVRAIAEQEEPPEYEPRADVIRGGGAIVRRISKARGKEGSASQVEPTDQNDSIIEWDGLRRRKSDPMDISAFDSDYDGDDNTPLGILQRRRFGNPPTSDPRQSKKDESSTDDISSSPEEKKEAAQIAAATETATNMKAQVVALLEAQIAANSITSTDARKDDTAAIDWKEFAALFKDSDIPIDPKPDVDRSILPAVEDLQKACGWQLGNNNCFLELSDEPVSKPHRAGREHLGHGRTGIVEEVQCATGIVSFVRKRIQVPSTFVAQRETAIKAIKREIGIMRKVHHPNIVTLIGSYQEKLSYHHYYFLLMFPAGESDLEAFLRVTSENSQQDVHADATWERLQWIKSWFECLASALAYLHGRGIYHEDIKPRNIIHRGNMIYFTDFGSSREIDLASQMTSTENPALSTRLYAAPEAMTDEDGNLRRHGSKSDVFSLGVVFVEMLIVLEGKTVPSLREGLPPSTPYHAIVHTLRDRFTNQKSFFTKIIEPSLALNRSQRLSALELLDLVRSVSVWSSYHCTCQQLNVVAPNGVPPTEAARPDNLDRNEAFDTSEIRSDSKARV